MSIKMPENLKRHEHSTWFESLPLKDQQEYVRSQNPVLVKKQSVIKQQKEKYGDYYYAMQLDNGWYHCCSPTKEETVRRHNEFLNRG